MQYSTTLTKAAFSILAVLKAAKAAPQPPTTGFYDTVEFDCYEALIPQPGVNVGYFTSYLTVDWNGMGKVRGSCTIDPNYGNGANCDLTPPAGAINKETYHVYAIWDPAGGTCDISFTAGSVEYSTKTGSPGNGDGECGTIDPSVGSGDPSRAICYVHLGV